MYYLYSMKLGNSGIVKIGQSNDVNRRRTEHGRRFGCPKQVEVLSAIPFTSRNTVEKLEQALIDACKQAGLVMVQDKQAGDTERFYINESVRTVSIQVRKITYEIRVF